MSDKENTEETMATSGEGESPETSTTRREFLLSLGKWSGAIIAAVAGANLLDPPRAAGWLNGGGGAWVNARGGGGGGSWVNRSGGGGGWVNRGGGGGAWVNRGGGGAWVNSRGGWINR